MKQQYKSLIYNIDSSDKMKQQYSLVQFDKNIIWVKTD